jgi:hypothetical protein
VADRPHAINCPPARRGDRPCGGRGARAAPSSRGGDVPGSGVAGRRS